MFLTLKLLFIDQCGKLFDLVASNTDYSGCLNANFKINFFSNLAHTFSKLMEQRESKVIVEVHNKKRAKCVDNASIPTLDKDNEQEDSATIADINRQKSYSPRPICNDEPCKFDFIIVCHKDDY